MKTKHTQGLIIAEAAIKQQSGLYECKVTNSMGRVYYRAYGETKEIAEANAKIAKAAPELLKTFIDMVEMESTPDHIRKYAKKAIREAT